MKIKVINKSKHELPGYATGAAAGMDLRANIEDPIVLKSLERTLVNSVAMCWQSAALPPLPQSNTLPPDKKVFTIN